MKKKMLLGITMMLSIAIPISASCGSATCPILSYTPLTNTRLEYGISYESIDQDQVYVGTHRSSIGAIPEHHDEVETLNHQTLLRVACQPAEDWRIRVELPYISRYHEHIHNHHGNKILETWNISGLGDTTLYVDHTLGNFGISAGIKFATGETRQKNDDGDEAEVPVQPGTGSTDYSLALFYQTGVLTLQNLDQNHVELPVKMGLSYTLTGKGTDDWKMGNKWIGYLGTSYKLNSNWTLDADITAKIQDKSNAGTTGDPSANTGGTWVYLSPGIRYELTKGLTLNTLAQFPIYQDVHGIQLTSPYNVQLGLTIQVQ